jgi:hypothetical protein
MKIETWAVTAVGIAVAVVVPLIVNYQNRKQARQIELFKKDPSVGLIPPPHPLWVFLRKNWQHFFYPSVMVYYVYRWMIEDWQHSYHAGVSAALFVLYLTTYQFINMLALSGRFVGSVTGHITQVIDWVSDDTSNAIRVLEVHNEMLLSLLEDLESRGLLSESAKARIRTAREKAHTSITKKESTQQRTGS